MELIDRQAAINEIRDYKTEPNISDDESEIKGYNDGIDLTVSVLSTLPTIEERKKGKWIKLYSGNYKCSQCGDWWATDDNEMIENFNFCPNCGADMRGDTDG